MLHSPLHLGQVIYPSDEDFDAVWAVVKTSPKEHLAKGLLCEYAHNAAFTAAGWEFETTFTTNVFDRRFNSMMQDDKLATLTDNGHSKTHTISGAELVAWFLEGDVIIHSFEEMDDGRNGSRYRGAISFRRLIEAELLRPSKFDATSYFDRLAALRLARA